MGSKKLKYLMAALLVLLSTGPCKKGLYVAIEGDSIFLKAALDRIKPGESVKVTVTGVKADGHPMPDQTLVRLEADRGKLLDKNDLPVEAVLLFSGRGEVTYRSEADFAPGPATIKAHCGAAKINPEELIIIILDIDITQLFISAEPAKIPPNSDETVITVTAFNGEMEPVPGRTIWLETTAGILTADPGGSRGTVISLESDPEGKVSAVLRTDTPATVTASYKEIKKTINITIGVNQDPVPDFEFSPQNPVSGETIYFNSTSSDPDGTLTSQDWNFGDGQSDTGAETTHSYHVDENKTFTVTLTVTDNDNAVKTKTKPVPVTVTVNIPPTAIFSFSPQQPQVNEEVNFNASASKDEDGTVEYYKWDFGDGNFTGWQTGERSSHPYGKQGTFTVILQVKDNQGGIGTANRDITIGGAENQPPTAAFTYSPTQPRSGEDIRFNPQASTDKDGQIARYDWDFGDGVTGAATEMQVVIHSYEVNEETTFTVTLKVTDDDGAVGVASQPVTVRPTPVARFTFSPLAPKTGETVVFDAGSSEGEIVRYDWFFGDGSGRKTTTASTITHIYTVARAYTVTLTVTDNKNRQHTTSAAITIAE